MSPGINGCLLCRLYKYMANLMVMMMLNMRPNSSLEWVECIFQNVNLEPCGKNSTCRVVKTPRMQSFQILYFKSARSRVLVPPKAKSSVITSSEYLKCNSVGTLASKQWVSFCLFVLTRHQRVTNVSVGMLASNQWVS